MAWCQRPGTDTDEALALGHQVQREQPELASGELQGEGGAFPFLLHTALTHFTNRQNTVSGVMVLMLRMSSSRQ